MELDTRRLNFNVKMELIDPPKKEVLTSIDFLIRNTLDPLSARPDWKKW